MKTKYLRIGNYVNHICNDELVTDVIADIGYYLLSSPKSITSRKDNEVMETLKPVPLTKEWLIKFGFVSNGYGEYDKGDYIIDNEYTDKGVYYFADSDGFRLCSIKYVHQLQNLYFALTGEELKTKDNE